MKTIWRSWDGHLVFGFSLLLFPVALRLSCRDSQNSVTPRLYIQPANIFDTVCATTKYGISQKLHNQLMPEFSQ